MTGSSRAAEGVPRQPALIAGDRTMTFAELEREAVAAARRLAGLGVGRGRPRGPVCRALDRARRRAAWPREAGRGGRAARPERPGAEQVALLGALEPALVVREPGEVLEAPERADAALDDVAGLRRAAQRDPHLRDEREPEGRHAHLREPSLERGRLRGPDRRVTVGPVALLPAAAPRRRLRDPRARGAVPDRGRAGALRRGHGLRSGGRAPCDDRLARAHDARATAGRGRSPRAPSVRADRGRAAAAATARAGARGRRAGGADLRADRVRLAGRDDVARRGP